MENNNTFTIVDIDINEENQSRHEDEPRKTDQKKIIKIQRERGERDYIGFATLPEQVHRKSVKRGFDFTMMVVGESGLGKSTLINSLFLGDLYHNRKIPDVQDRIGKTTTIEKKTMEIEERGVKLRLTIVDTPGFGDAINCEDSWRVCTAYVDEQFRQYFTDESGLNRRHMQDNRVHCCLYFVPPWTHSLRQVDLEMMKRLHRKVNIVVLIAKADSLTAAEVKRLKARILQDLEEHQIQFGAGLFGGNRIFNGERLGRRNEPPELSLEEMQQRKLQLFVRIPREALVVPTSFCAAVNLTTIWLDHMQETAKI
ncbi:Septin-2 [Eumeta japonica]|uniref:Septin-2 n=1 Tax=Eumeta variegata TaxID=151549 RepID=A0A4C1XCL0_EUMVA|nr:Septin-2 [Eumeta japonica]